MGIKITLDYTCMYMYSEISLYLLYMYSEISLYTVHYIWACCYIEEVKMLEIVCHREVTYIYSTEHDYIDSFIVLSVGLYMYELL